MTIRSSEGARPTHDRWAIRHRPCTPPTFVAQPSHYEAFGVSLIEAMATGLPIVASGAGGMADHLVQDENALIAGPQAPERLAASLARLLASEVERRRFGAAARRTVEERFTVRAMGAAYLMMFEELMSARGADRGEASARPSA
jgi:glycosyltransferase involved in cell wall biosynthesis